jgi:signal transduction histidine kinase
MNLILSSMDAMLAMPSGRALIGRTEANGASSVVASILDSGPGIPSEKLNEIFDPFFTIKKARNGNRPVDRTHHRSGAQGTYLGRGPG